MSDFDFDEIDRAVNGVIGDEASREPDAQSVPHTPQLGANPVSAAPSAPATSSSKEKPELSSPITRSAPAVRRSSGRFMDMVHSSSDMRSRSAPAVIPSKPATTPVATPTVSTTSSDTTEFNNDLAAITDDWQKSTESPFLPDAKVEKRPLGGEPIASTMKLEDLLNEPDDALLSTGKQEDLIEAPDDPRIEAHTMPDPIDFAASRDAPAAEDGAPEAEPESPAEAAITDTLNNQEPVVDLDAAIEDVAPEESSSETPQNTPAEQSVSEEPATTPQDQPVASEEPTGPTSISQQYKEQPSSQQESGAIYDTEAYHQPLAKPPKKHSGALAIVWILLLVLLGAGAGAAFYVYVLPML